MSAALERVSAAFIAGYFRFHPHHGSEKGYAEVDALPPVYDDEAVSEFRALLAATDRALAELPPPREADVDAAVDRAVLRLIIDAARLQLDELDGLARLPHLYVEASLESIETLRLRVAGGERVPTSAFAARLRGIERNLAVARARVRAPDEWSLEVAREMASEGAAELDANAERRALGPEAAAAAASAVAALRSYAAHLDETRPRARPFHAMGRAAYERLLASEHALTEGLAYWQREAEGFLADTERARRGLVRPPRRLEDAYPAGPRPADIWAFFTDELALLERLIVERELVTIPAGALELAAFPAFLAETNGAGMYHPPPSFSRGHTGFFFVAPVPETLDDDELERFRWRFEHRSFLTLAVHEAFPGHHVQFLHAMNHPRPIRKFRDFDIFVEGWAHYCEEMMWSAALHELPGYQFPTRSLRFRALRVLVDSTLHAGELSPREAGRLMADRMGVERSPWIERELRRYALAPGQAFSYFAGKRVLERLRAAREAEEGPRFRLREFHDQLLAEGSIPVHLCARKWSRAPS